jgi:hypothetical protein
MHNPWFVASLLAFEAFDVMHLRMWKLAEGGRIAIEEGELMITEKIAATCEAFGSLLLGNSPLSIIQRYRDLVAANALRLSS